MPVYSRQIATAQRLIKKKGQLVIWQKHSVTVNDAQPWKVGNPVGAVPTFPVFIVFLPPKDADIHLLEGTTVPEGKPRGLMGAVTGFIPAIDDYVLRGSETLRIKDIVELNPNGESVILYKIDFA